MATFRKRSSKWHVQVRRSGHPAITRSFSHKADAEAWARKIERQIDSGDILFDHQALKSQTVRSLLERYETTITPQKRGAKVEAYHLRAIKTHKIALCSLVSLTPGQVSKFRDDRLKKASEGTVRRELGILRHCLEVARREWDVPLPINPVTQIQIPSPGKARERRLTSDEYDALMDGCRDSRNNYLAPIILLAIETAMRRGEILAMRWVDIDFEAQLLRIPITKNGHRRTIPLTDKAVDILMALEQQDDVVFAVSSNAFQLAWRRLKQRAGIRDLRFHDLRHEAVSRFFELGLSVPEVALISGHRDPRMLFRYTHLRAEEVAAKIRSITPKEDGKNQPQKPRYTQAPQKYGKMKSKALSGIFNSMDFKNPSKDTPSCQPITEYAVEVERDLNSLFGIPLTTAMKELVKQAHEYGVDATNCVSIIGASFELHSLTR